MLSLMLYHACGRVGAISEERLFFRFVAVLEKSVAGNFSVLKH